MDSASGVAAWDALRKAQAQLASAAPVERAYINALATRYSAKPTADRARLDSAYARAMTELTRKYPSDQDAAVLASEAAMLLRPWNYWDKKGAPYAGTTELVSRLENVMRANRDHPGACHFYIHAVEAVQAQKAVACAERLAALMPGAGHIVHMPAHIYIRVGRWNDAIESNRHAVHTDESYIADQKPTGVYPIAYGVHNYHFLAFAATMAGQSKLAIEQAHHVREHVPVETAAALSIAQPFVAYPFLSMVTFGRWDDVLREPAPAANLPVAVALAAYARGIAHAAKGHEGVARQELATLNANAKKVTDEPLKSVLAIAQHALLGEIALRTNKLAEAEQHFTVAMKMEDALNYMEPPDWYYPIRHSLGVVLLKQNKTAAAEKLYREDLVRFPENGWALFGLAQSLRAQKKNTEAAEVEARFKKAWAGADVSLTGSRF
jgi:tetratricopeptide (TPR) repeat protein